MVVPFFDVDNDPGSNFTSLLRKVGLDPFTVSSFGDSQQVLAPMPRQSWLCAISMASSWRAIDGPLWATGFLIAKWKKLSQRTDIAV